MNSISRLSKENFKANKGKNILIVIAIMLSTCLITSIGILSYSIKQMDIKRTTQLTGEAHASFKKLTENQLQVLKNHKDVEMVGEYIPIGSDDNEKYAPYSLCLIYEDENSAKLSNHMLKEGKWPKKDNEIVIEKRICEKMGVKPKIGETINVNYVNCFRWQSSFNIKDKFIVCGFLDVPDIQKLQSSTTLGIVTKNYVSKKLETKNINIKAFVKLKSLDIKNVSNKIAKDIGVEEEDIGLNKQYIEAMGLDTQVLTMSIIIGAVVVIATVLVIYNIFIIHIRERIKLFGLLAALGATEKQIRRLIFKEGMILSAIGIPIGIVLGHILSFIVGPLVALAGSEIEVKTSPIIIPIAITVSLFAVIISLMKPSRIASKISPIEAVRYTGVEISSKRKERKSKGTINLRKLAYLNLWRNKKRTITTIISISLTGVLIIVFSTLFNSVDIDILASNSVNGDIELTSNNVLYKDNGDNPLTKDILKKIKNLDGVESVNILKFSLPDFIDGRTCNFYGYDDNLLEMSRKYLESGDVSIEDFKNKDVVLIYIPKGWASKEKRYGSYKVGDEVKVKYYTNDVEKHTKTLIEKKFIIAGKIHKMPADFPFSFTGPTFIAYEGAFNRIFNDDRIQKIAINIDNKKYETVNRAIKSISDKNERISYMSKKEYKDKQEKEILGEKIASMSLVGIIGLLGVVNLINTMITSIMSRKKELGMMQAVGLSNKQLKKLLQIEGLYYSVIGIIISIFGGVGLGYMNYLSMKTEGNEHIVYNLPMIPILTVVVGFLAVQILVTRMVEKNLHKETVIERVRYSE